MNSVGKEKSRMEQDAQCTALSLSSRKKKKGKKKKGGLNKGNGWEGKGEESIPHPHGGRQS